jgi:acetyl-CoA carboxylase biotin carboxyl carrier protein
MFISEKYIRKLIRLVEESDIESIEVSSWGRRVKITQRVNASSNCHSNAPAVVANQAVSTPAPPAETVSVSTAPATEEEKTVDEASDRYVAIKSPMVGTFYAAHSPDAAPYVTLNEKVTVGQVVCIVEAMKLMNEIESDVSGRIVKICVENAQPVEFGQPLFLIDPEG